MTQQQPIASPFGAASTAKEVVAGIDLTGKVAIVTGGHSGLGLETTRALAGAGAHIVVPARDVEGAEAALAGIANVAVARMDLSDAGSIASFAEAFAATGRPLSMLINSAGIMATPLARDSQGHESQFATNHLGHFRLVRALWPALAAALGARVVSVSSRAHQLADMDFEDFDFVRRPYEKWAAYGQSKTANALFAVELDRRGQAEGIRAFSLHPGQILTRLARHLTEEEVSGFDAFDADGALRIDPDNGYKSVEQGAATSVWAATSALLDGLGGVYCEDCNIAPVNRAEVGRRGVAPWATDAEHAARLWALSESLTRD